MALQQTQNKPATEKKLNDSQQCRYIGTYYILAKKSLQIWSKVIFTS